MSKWDFFLAILKEICLNNRCTKYRFFGTKKEQENDLERKNFQTWAVDDSLSLSVFEN
jgi:hypothetical protein